MNPYLRAAERLRQVAEQKLQARRAEDPQRARNEDGTFKSDDPTTPDVNEAWEQA